MDVPDTVRRLFDQRPHLRNLVCYGSGYPSWDTIWPETVEELAPADWHADLLHNNAEACEL